MHRVLFGGNSQPFRLGYEGTHASTKFTRATSFHTSVAAVFACLGLGVFTTTAPSIKSCYLHSSRIREVSQTGCFVLGSRVNQIPLKMSRSRSKELCILPPPPKSQDNIRKKVDFWVSTQGRFVWQYPLTGARPPKSQHDGTRIGIKINYTIFGSSALRHFGRKALWAVRIVRGNPQGVLSSK